MFRFTIRDLFWLTALLAMGVAWSVDRWQLQQAVQRQDWQISKLIGHFRDVEGATVQHSPAGVLVVETGWDDGGSYWYPVKPETTYPPEELIEKVLQAKVKPPSPNSNP